MDGHETFCLIVSPDEGFNLFCCSTHRPAVVIAHAGTPNYHSMPNWALGPSSATGGWHYFFPLDVCSMLT